LEKKLHAARSVLNGCKRWIGRLPEGTTLEPVEVNVAGQDVASVRATIKRVEVELADLRAVPTPSSDIRQRIERYVSDMGKPEVTGVGEGQQLKIVWPGAGYDISGPRTDRADILPMVALLFPDQMVDALMRQIASDPASVATRQKRIAELEAKLERLQRQAIALGENLSVEFSPPVLLGVRIAQAKRVERAA
jgi:hypothetical protein